MKTKILLALCFALSLCVEVYAEDEQEVRRGLYPFMAFLYYPDETVVDGTGARFLRGAVLIRPEWLVTSAVGPSILTDGPSGFPRKTLLARMGAVTIDTNFTLNEDEDEQEREIIQIVRPFNHSSTQWWRTDISLMRTLLPFNLTSAVGVVSISTRREYLDKTCIILVYAKKDGNWTEERNLMQLTVELLPPSIQNCGSHFLGNTMTCAADSDENKNPVYDPNFCQGNSGGPLLCEREVMGIQTYIDNDCKQPHLYQLLTSWENFITCGTGNKCHDEVCTHVCDVANKDPPIVNPAIISSLKPLASLMSATTSNTIPIGSSAAADSTSEESEKPSSTPTTGTTDEITPTDSPTVHEPGDRVETVETKSWPNEKYPSKKQGEAETLERKPSVEARQHDVRPKSAGRSCVSNSQTLFFGFFILACLI
ncbi:unnamed protein product [Chrysodeixis includens]|uniref:Peptidase S1 domain-containing protein n=1 Tax=Chrysodeixis includens TaxID=689277 RepID=A0A9P0C6K1_CHRIL|nr:unnamed protein product [Chrysodeixis includens]